MQTIALGHYFARIAVLVLLGGGSHIHLQRVGDIARAADILLEDGGADENIGLRIECDLFAAQRVEFLAVVTRNHLHQAFRAHYALGDRVET